MAVGDNDVDSDVNKRINNKVGDPTLKKDRVAKDLAA